MYMFMRFSVVFQQMYTVCADQTGVIAFFCRHLFGLEPSSSLLLDFNKYIIGYMRAIIVLMHCGTPELDPFI